MFGHLNQQQPQRQVIPSPTRRNSIRNPPRQPFSAGVSLYRMASWTLIAGTHHWRYWTAFSLSGFLAHHAWHLSDSVFHYPDHQVPWLYPAFLVSLIVLQIRIFERLFHFLIPPLEKPLITKEEPTKGHDQKSRSHS